MDRTMDGLVRKVLLCNIFFHIASVEIRHTTHRPIQIYIYIYVYIRVVPADSYRSYHLCSVLSTNHDMQGSEKHYTFDVLEINT